MNKPTGAMLRRALILTTLCAGGLRAQVIKGVVRDSSAGAPLEGATLALMDASNRKVANAKSDTAGRYVLRAPAGGTFTIVTTRIGFVRNVSSPVSMTGADTLDVALTLAPTATTLAAVTIKAERDSLREVRLLGLNLKAINGAIVTPTEVREAAAKSFTVVDLVNSLHIPWLHIKHIKVQTLPGLPAGWYTCIVYSRTGDCVSVVVDGLRYTNYSDLLQLDNVTQAANISYMVYLLPQEAGVLYGTGTDNGLLIIVTKGSRR